MLETDILYGYYRNLYGHYNILGLEFLSSFILFFIVLLLLAISRNRKPMVNKNEIQRVSFLSLFLYTFRRFLGRCNIQICELFMQMGSLLSVPYYSSPLVVVSNDYEVIKQMLSSSDVWLDRPKNEIITYRANGDQNRGILTSSGPVWKETRRYTVKTLIQLGLGKKSNLEYTTNEELKGLLQDAHSRIQKSNNKVPMRGFFSLATINVIWRIAGGTRFSLKDPEFIEIVDATDKLTELSFYQVMFSEFIGMAAIVNSPRLFQFSKQIRALETMKNHFTKMLERRQKALSSEKDDLENENFTDSFLRKLNLNKNSDNNKMDPVFNLENLLVTLFDLFEAGVDTTSSTLEFAVMYLAAHPEVQKKMRAEIEIVIGDKEPSFYTDRINMPYTQAVITEVHRMASIVPFNSRGSVRDCYIKDTFIKKGTAAMINLYSIHYDRQFWGDPYNFRPERFLNDSGQLDNNKLCRVLNFGAGKRVCIGEVVASISVFTFLVGILQKYELQKADPREEYGMVINSSFTNRPKTFHLSFIPVK